jgi:PKD repeat protein
MKNKLKLLTTILILFQITSCSKKDDDQNPTPAAPVANFTYTGAGVPAPATVNFTNTSTNATSYSWDFGDNSTSTETNPSHTYLTGGVFTVNLTATGQGGSNSISKTVNIQNPAGPIANFNFSNGGCQAPCIVSFTDASTGATSWNWDFGNGQTSTMQNPSVTYNTGGNYTVQLTVSGPTGSNSTSKSVNIVAAPTICKISQICIMNCSLTDGSGTGWDAFSGPDFYINIETVSGTILLNGQSAHNTDNPNFPQCWNVNPTYNFANTSWNTTYRIAIWEYDSPDPDDFVGYCNFLLSNYTTVTNHYPTTINLTNGSNQIRLTVQWQ